MAFLTREEYNKIRESGATQEEARNYLFESSNLASARQEYNNAYSNKPYSTTIPTRSEFDAQYEAARSSGLSRDEAIKGIASGTRYTQQAVQDVTGERPRTATQTQTQQTQQTFDIDSARKQLEQIGSTTTDKQLAKLIKKYGFDSSAKDNFWGQSKANYELQAISQDALRAWNRYADNPTAENKAIVDAYGLLTQVYQTANYEALDNENVKVGWASKNIAGYLPQLFRQIGNSGSFMAGGAAAGAGAGALKGAGITAIAIPGLGVDDAAGALTGAVIGGAKGAGLGYAAGSATYSYEVMRGAAVQTLTNAGLDMDKAKEAATDEAIVSSIIEFGDTAFDLLGKVPGIGKIKDKIGQKAIGAIAKWAFNIKEEGWEEKYQEILSIANERRCAKGEYGSGIEGLLNEAVKVIQEYNSGALGEETIGRVKENQRGGEIIGAFMGPAHAVFNAAVVNPAMKPVNNLINAERQRALETQLSRDASNTYDSDTFRANQTAVDNATSAYRDVATPLAVATTGKILIDQDGNRLGSVTVANDVGIQITLDGIGKGIATVKKMGNLAGMLDISNDSNGELYNALNNGAFFVDEAELENFQLANQRQQSETPDVTPPREPDYQAEAEYEASREGQFTSDDAWRESEEEARLDNIAKKEGDSTEGGYQEESIESKTNRARSYVASRAKGQKITIGELQQSLKISKKDAENIFAWLYREGVLNNDNTIPSDTNSILRDETTSRNDHEEPAMPTRPNRNNDISSLNKRFSVVFEVYGEDGKLQSLENDEVYAQDEEKAKEIIKNQYGDKFSEVVKVSEYKPKKKQAEKKPQTKKAESQEPQQPVPEAPPSAEDIADFESGNLSDVAEETATPTETTYLSKAEKWFAENPTKRKYEDEYHGRKVYLTKMGSSYIVRVQKVGKYGQLLKSDISIGSASTIEGANKILNEYFAKEEQTKKETPVSESQKQPEKAAQSNSESTPTDTQPTSDENSQPANDKLNSKDEGSSSEGANEDSGESSEGESRPKTIGDFVFDKLTVEKKSSVHFAMPNQPGVEVIIEADRESGKARIRYAFKLNTGGYSEAVNVGEATTIEDVNKLIEEASAKIDKANKEKEAEARSKAKHDRIQAVNKITSGLTPSGSALELKDSRDIYRDIRSIGDSVGIKRSRFQPYKEYIDKILFTLRDKLSGYYGDKVLSHRIVRDEKTGKLKLSDKNIDIGTISNVSTGYGSASSREDQDSIDFIIDQAYNLNNEDFAELADLDSDEITHGEHGFRPSMRDEDTGANASLAVAKKNYDDFKAELDKRAEEEGKAPTEKQLDELERRRRLYDLASISNKTSSFINYIQRVVVDLDEIDGEEKTVFRLGYNENPTVADVYENLVSKMRRLEDRSKPHDIYLGDNGESGKLVVPDSEKDFSSQISLFNIELDPDIEAGLKNILGDKLGDRDIREVPISELWDADEEAAKLFGEERFIHEPVKPTDWEELAKNARLAHDFMQNISELEKRGDFHYYEAGAKYVSGKAAYEDSPLVNQGAIDTFEDYGLDVRELQEYFNGQLESGEETYSADEITGKVGEKNDKKAVSANTDATEALQAVADRFTEQVKNRDDELGDIANYLDWYLEADGHGGIRASYDELALANLLSDPYFDRPAPSTDKVLDYTNPDVQFTDIKNALSALLPGEDFRLEQDDKGFPVILQAHKRSNSKTIAYELSGGRAWSDSNLNRLAKDLLLDPWSYTLAPGYDKNDPTHRSSRTEKLIPYSEARLLFAEDPAAKKKYENSYVTGPNGERYYSVPENFMATLTQEQAEKIWKSDYKGHKFEEVFGKGYLNSKGERVYPLNKTRLENIANHTTKKIKNLFHYIIQRDLPGLAKRYIEEQTKETKAGIERWEKKIEALEEQARKLRSSEDFFNAIGGAAKANDQMMTLQDIETDIAEARENIMLSEKFIYDLAHYGVKLWEAGDTTIGYQLFGGPEEEGSIANQFGMMSVTGMANSTDQRAAYEMLNQFLRGDETLRGSREQLEHPENYAGKKANFAGASQFTAPDGTRTNIRNSVISVVDSAKKFREATERWAKLTDKQRLERIQSDGDYIPNRTDGQPDAIYIQREDGETYQFTADGKWRSLGYAREGASLSGSNNNGQNLDDKGSNGILSEKQREARRKNHEHIKEASKQIISDLENSSQVSGFHTGAKPGKSGRKVTAMVLNQEEGIFLKGEITGVFEVKTTPNEPLVEYEDLLELDNSEPKTLMEKAMQAARNQEKINQNEEIKKRNKEAEKRNEEIRRKNKSNAFKDYLMAKAWNAMVELDLPTLHFNGKLYNRHGDWHFDQTGAFISDDAEGYTTEAFAANFKDYVLVSDEMTAPNECAHEYTHDFVGKNFSEDKGKKLIEMTRRVCEKAEIGYDEIIDFISGFYGGTEADLAEELVCRIAEGSMLTQESTNYNYLTEEEIARLRLALFTDDAWTEATTEYPFYLDLVRSVAPIWDKAFSTETLAGHIARRQMFKEIQGQTEEVYDENGKVVGSFDYSKVRPHRYLGHGTETVDTKSEQALQERREMQERELYGSEELNRHINRTTNRRRTWGENEDGTYGYTYYDETNEMWVTDGRIEKRNVPKALPSAMTEAEASHQDIKNYRQRRREQAIAEAKAAEEAEGRTEGVKFKKRIGPSEAETNFLNFFNEISETPQQAQFYYDKAVEMVDRMIAGNPQPISDKAIDAYRAFAESEGYELVKRKNGYYVAEEIEEEVSPEQKITDILNGVEKEDEYDHYYGGVGTDPENYSSWDANYESKEDYAEEQRLVEEMKRSDQITPQDGISTDRDRRLNARANSRMDDKTAQTLYGDGFEGWSENNGKKTKESAWGTTKNAPRQRIDEVEKRIGKTHAIFERKGWDKVIEGNNNQAKYQKVRDNYNRTIRIIRDVCEGQSLIRDLYTHASNLEKSFGTGTYFPEEIVDALRTASAAEERALETGNRYDAIEAMEVGSKAVTSLVQRIEDVNRLQPVKQQLQKSALAHKASGKTIEDINLAAASWQLTGANIFRMIDGFDADAHGSGYMLAEKLETAIINSFKDENELRHFFDLENLRKNNAFTSNEASGIKIEDIEISLQDAVQLKFIIDTLYNTPAGETVDKKKFISRLSTIGGLAFLDSKGGKRIFDYQREVTREDGETVTENKTEELYGAYVQIADALRAGEGKWAVANEYYQAKMEMYEYGKELSVPTFKKIFGFEPDMYEKGAYATIQYASRDDVESDNLDAVETVQNMSMMQSRTRKVGGYVVVRPCSQDTERYIKRVTNYAAFADLANDLSILNDENDYLGSLSSIMGQNFGTSMERATNSIVDDISILRGGDEPQSNANKWLAKFRSAVTQGALLGSISVPIKQVASYFSAMTVVSPRNIIRAYRSKIIPGKGDAAGNALYSMRGRGSITPETADFLKVGWVQRLNNTKMGHWLVNATNIMDSRTVDNIYTACVLDVEDMLGKKQVGTPYFTEMVGALFEEAIVRTQPIFTKQARAEYARSKNELIRSLSMFRTQQTQNYNQLFRAIAEAKAAKNSGGNAQAANKRLTNTVTGYVCSTVSLTALTAIANVLLHKHKKYKDDDDEWDAGKIFNRLGLDFFENLASFHVFGSELAKIAIDKINEVRGDDDASKEFYGVSMGAVTSIVNIGKAMGNCIEYPSVSNFRYLVNYVATMGGIPIQNAYSLVNSGVMWYKDLFDKAGYDSNDMIRNWEKAQKDYGNRLFQYVKAGREEKALDMVGKMGKDFKSDIKDTAVTKLGKGEYSDEEIVSMLVRYADMFEDDARDFVAQSYMEVDTGYEYSKLKDYWADGEISDEEAIAYLQSYGGKDEDKAVETVEDWTRDRATQAEYGYKYDYLDDAYRSTKIDRDEYKEALMTYGNMTEEKAENTILQQDFRHEFGVPYNNMKSAYREGKISPQDVIKWRMKIGGVSRETAQSWLDAQNLFLNTGYEATTIIRSTMYDTYEQNAKMGAMTFYNTYGGMFKKPADFGEVMMAVDDYKDVTVTSLRPTYNNKYTTSEKQEAILQILNSYIDSGKISHELAYRIWADYEGYSTNARGAIQYLH